MPFSKIQGHEKIVTHLNSVYDSDHIPSAYLFVGSDGIGKTTIVREFARLINCEEAVPCGKCNNCKLFEQSSHPDFLVIRPKTRYIEIKAIRELIDHLALKPAYAQKRIVIVKHAHLMRTEAANCFLKILEEPPLDTLIVVMTPDQDLLLETIRSRCQAVHFSPLHQEVLKNIIPTLYPLKEEDLRFALNFTQGRIRKDFLKKATLLNTMRSQVFRILAHLTPDRMMDHCYLLELWIKQENYVYFLEFCTAFIKDLVIIQQHSSSLIQNNDMLPDLEKLALTINREQLMLSFALVIETEIAIQTNAAKLLALEGLLVQMKQIFEGSAII